MLKATTYTRIYGQQQLGKCLCVAGSQPTRKKICIHSHKIFSYVLFVQKYFYNKIKPNYGKSGDGEGLGMWLDSICCQKLSLGSTEVEEEGTEQAEYPTNIQTCQAKVTP